MLTLGHLVRVEPARNDSSGSGRILIVGSENPINLDGYRFFHDEVWPLIRSRLPKATLSVAGKLSHHVEVEDGIENLGVIPDMIDAYRGIDVAVNPVLCGTGLNIKSIEALGFGVPLVATPSGARGLEHAAGRGLSIAESAQDFADAVISLVLDRALRQQTASRAIETAREWNSSALARLEQMLEQTAPVRGQFPIS